MAKSKVHKSKDMGLQDNFYTSVDAPLDSYPRIKYFQSRLKDIFPRLQRLYDSVPKSLKRPQSESKKVSDAVKQVTVSSPVLFLFGATHSKIPKADLVQESGNIKYKTHSLEKIPSFDDSQKKHKLFSVICTLKMIETRKGKETLVKMKDCVGVENMLFFVDAEYEKDKDSVANNLERLREFLKPKIIVVYQSKIELSAAISNHMERKFIKVFRLLNQYLIKATWKTKHTCGSIFGQEDANDRLAAAIMAFFKTPLTMLDLLLTVEPESSEKVINIEKATKIAIVRCTKLVLIGEVESTYEVKGISVHEYLEEHKYNENCLMLLEQSVDVRKFLCKAQPIEPQLITQLQRLPENQKSINSVMKLLSESGLDERGSNISGKRRKGNISLQTQFEAFSKTIADEVSKVLLSYFLDIGNTFKGFMSKLDTLSQLREELVRIMEQTSDKRIYGVVMPDLQSWTDLLGRIKEVQAVGHMFGKLYVFVKEPEAGERENEVLTTIRKCLVDYPGGIRIEVSSNSFYSGGDGTESSKKIAMGDAFLNGSCRGTIGLFMTKNGNESEDLHFVTSSHVVLQSEDVTTIDPTPVPLGRRAHIVTTDNKLLDISVIRVHPNMRDRCNTLFHDNNKTRKCHILDSENTKRLMAPGVRVYKRGSTSELTTGSIICKDLKQFGLQKHNLVVGVPAGSDEETIKKGFAQKGDSGAVVYTETPEGEIQYMAILMGEFESRDTEDKSVEELKQMVGPLIVTSSLSEGLDKVQTMFNCKLALPS
ncbi:hypothetical protein CHS0354_035048 [Potamilus streckersoni]|uniref:Uncharacterized protein n=1 Tax=Potamilus streckersoni TaxID=2493646 RepID=A0AAE0SAQ0_9BIVA|nr:hypothetical protein CHS0354_035048 [Potamilus streckersoni]